MKLKTKKWIWLGLLGGVGLTGYFFAAPEFYESLYPQENKSIEEFDPHFSELIDFDNDGDLDLIVGVPNSEEEIFFENDGKGNFKLKPSYSE